MSIFRLLILALVAMLLLSHGSPMMAHEHGHGHGHGHGHAHEIGGVSHDAPGIDHDQHGDMGEDELPVASHIHLVPDRVVGEAGLVARPRLRVIGERQPPDPALPSHVIKPLLEPPA
jgi:hypothetical protein